jgi:hypothetical protein
MDEQETEAQSASRRYLVSTMPAELDARRAAGERIWDTGKLQEDFEVLGFEAPFVVVRRRADGVKGSLMFTHQPRFYFGWEAAV